MEEEIWKPLVYHGEYFGDTHEISNMGRLRSVKTNKILKQTINHEGYLTTTISRGRKRGICIRIHRAVAENFVDGDKTLVINHKDLNKLNNCWDNLEFVTSQENTLHAVKNGALNTKLKECDLDSIWEMRQCGATYHEIAEAYGVCVDTIYLFLNGKTWKYYYNDKQDLLCKNKRHNKPTFEMLKQIADLKRMGLSIRKISEIVGVTYKQVEHFLHGDSYKQYSYLLAKQL